MFLEACTTHEYEVFVLHTLFLVQTGVQGGKIMRLLRCVLKGMTPHASCTAYN